MDDLKRLFSLDPQIHFLNHGSFGATPIPVFETYQEWQRQLERQPVLFLGRQLFDLLKESRTQLANYLNTEPNNLVYIPNVTHGVNIIARSLDLQPGDEILTSDHEYGACNYTWEFICKKIGAVYHPQSISLPITSENDILTQLWQGISPKTRVIYISHITSPTAIRFPVKAICARARQAGILTIIDGAHAPGQISLDLDAIGADFYVGNCHKWLLSPKGAGFLYARPDAQALLEPLIVSWGYHPTPQFTSGSSFIDLLQWTGTKDPAAYLTVPSAIQFQKDHDWEAVRIGCHNLLHDVVFNICSLFNQLPQLPLDSDLYHQMGIAPLPGDVNLEILKSRLYEEYHIEVPLIDWNGLKFIRISVQGYNSQLDLDILLQALKALV